MGGGRRRGPQAGGGLRGSGARTGAPRGGGDASGVPGGAEGRPRRGRGWGRAGPVKERRPAEGRGTDSPGDTGGATHVHRQLFVACGARATPAGAAQPPACGAAAAAAASVRHVGSRSRGPAPPPPWARPRMRELPAGGGAWRRFGGGAPEGLSPGILPLKSKIRKPYTARVSRASPATCFCPAPQASSERFSHLLRLEKLQKRALFGDGWKF